MISVHRGLRCGVVVALVLVGCKKTPALEAAEGPAPPSAAARSWYLQAVAAESWGDIDHAERAWGWVALEDGGRAYAHVHHARFLQRQRRWTEAERAWKRALDLDPGWWEPMFGLAALAGRAGDASQERAWLISAVEHGAEAVARERLIDVYRDGGERDQAILVLRGWLEQEPRDLGERRRRARAAERLQVVRLALPDLRVLAAVEEDPHAAHRFVEHARSSCQIHDALDWARALSDPQDPRARSGLLAAIQAGDLALIERLMNDTPPLDAPPSVDAPSQWSEGWLADPRIPAAVRLCVGWERAGYRERAEAWEAHLRSTPEGAVWVDLLQVDRRPDRVSAGALARLVAASNEHPSEPVVLAVAWHRRELSPAYVAGRLTGSTSDQRLFAEALAEIEAREPSLPSVSVVPVEGRMAREVEGKIGLSTSAFERWAGRRDEGLIARALAAGDRAAARRTAHRWTSRSPAEARAWLATARAEPSRARSSLDRALELEPCLVEAMVLRARLEEDAERRVWLERALRASPLDPAILTEARQAGVKPGGP